MTIGLVLLSIAAVLIFFGASEKFFRKIGISNWFAFALILALVVGAVVPTIRFGGAFSMNVGGFILPVIITVIFCALIGFNSELLRFFLAAVAVAGVAVAARMLIMPTSFATIITASVIVGFVGGSVAYLIGMSRLATIGAAVGGIVLGDIIVNLITRFMLGTGNIALGSNGVFDSVILSAATGIILVEAIAAVKRTMNRHQVKRTAFSMEASEENEMSADDVAAAVVEEDFSDYFED